EPVAVGEALLRGLVGLLLRRHGRGDVTLGAVGGRGELADTAVESDQALIGRLEALRVRGRPLGGLLQLILRGGHPPGEPRFGGAHLLAHEPLRGAWLEQQGTGAAHNERRNAWLHIWPPSWWSPESAGREAVAVPRCIDFSVAHRSSHAQP